MKGKKWEKEKEKKRVIRTRRKMKMKGEGEKIRKLDSPMSGRYRALSDEDKETCFPSCMTDSWLPFPGSFQIIRNILSIPIRTESDDRLLIKGRTWSADRCKTEWDHLVKDCRPDQVTNWPRRQSQKISWQIISRSRWSAGWSQAKPSDQLTDPRTDQGSAIRIRWSVDRSQAESVDHLTDYASGVRWSSSRYVESDHQLTDIRRKQLL